MLNFREIMSKKKKKIPFLDSELRERDLEFREREIERENGQEGGQSSDVIS